MTNEDIMKADVDTLLNMPHEMGSWIRENYKTVELIEDGLTVPEEYANLKWEFACLDGCDWKYGRFFICREKMLRRNTTFSEFYGNSPVD